MRKKEVGILYVPIEMAPNDIRFIDVTEIKKISYSKLVRYYSSIINPIVKDRINKTVLNFLFSSEELDNLIKKEEPKVINTTSNMEVEDEDNKLHITNDDKINNLLDKIDNDELSIEDVIELSGLGENSIMFFLKEKRRKEKTPLIDTKLFNRIYAEWEQKYITTKLAAKELGIKETSFYYYSNKIKTKK